MKNIAVGIDFTDVKDAVIQAAADMAKALGATLHVVHVSSPEPALVGYSGYAYPGPDEREEELSGEKEKLREIVDDLKAKGIDALGYMKSDETVRGLIEFAEHRNASLIILGTHNRSVIGRVILGSVAEGVIRKSRIPTLVVPTWDGENDKAPEE